MRNGTIRRSKLINRAKMQLKVTFIIKCYIKIILCRKPKEDITFASGNSLRNVWRTGVRVAHGRASGARACVWHTGTRTSALSQRTSDYPVSLKHFIKQVVRKLKIT